MNNEPNVTVTRDEYSKVLGDLVTVNGVKAGRVRRSEKGRTWCFAMEMPGVYGSGNWSRTKADAVATVVRAALHHMGK